MVTQPERNWNKKLTKKNKTTKCATYKRIFQNVGSLETTFCLSTYAPADQGMSISTQKNTKDQQIKV